MTTISEIIAARFHRERFGEAGDSAPSVPVTSSAPRCQITKISTPTQTRYRLVSRQPAASASSTEQNQRVPLLICILIFAYQRLVG
jgi:hypothetical protein